MNIIDNLDEFTPEELEIASRILGKFASLKKTPSPEPVKEPKANGKKSKKKAIAKVEQTITEQDQAEENNVQERVLSGPTSKIRKHKADGQPQKKLKGGKNKMATVQPIRITGQNRFLQMDAYNSCKGDTAIDKKLWANNRPTERREEIQFVEAECQVCHYVFDVNPAVVMRDEDTSEYVFTCNDCTKKG